MREDDEAAARRFPGPDFYEVLGWVHASLRPKTYFEIGVLNGMSLQCVQAATVVIGIDPEPRLSDTLPPHLQLFRETSTAFFARPDLPQLLNGPVQFGFIDGLHLFEQALDDFSHLERLCSRDAIVALHDTIPLDRETAARERSTEFYTGDVWKMVPFLREWRPDLEVVTVMTAPTGLTLVRGLNPLHHTPLDAKRIAHWTSLDFEYFERNHGTFVTIPNQRDAVEAFCQNTPVQSICSTGVTIPLLRR